MVIKKYEGNYQGEKITLEIIPDEYPENPREEWDNIGTMVCFHKRYSLGDENHNIESDWFFSWEEMEKYLYKKIDAGIVLPLYLYDHSGITISTSPFSCSWDSGQVGFIYVTKQKIRKEFNKKRISKKLLEKVKKILISEVNIYDQFLRGDIYSFLLKSNGEIIDSCHGFYGHDIRENGMLDHIPEEYRKAIAMKI